MLALAKRALDLLLENIDTNGSTLLPEDHDAAVELFLKVFKAPGNELPALEDLREHLVQQKETSAELAEMILACWKAVEMATVGHDNVYWIPDVAQTLLDD